MESANVSAQDKLDQMLHEGRITDDEYLRLSRAMTSRATTCSSQSPEPKSIVEGRKLRKNWEKAVIGGLCSGYATYFGVDERLIRTIFFLAVLLLFALGGLGIALVFAYFALCVFIPWDDEEKAKAFIKTGRPRSFMLAIAMLYFILPALYSGLVLPSLLSMYEQMGIKVWDFSFTSTLAGRAIDCASEYRSIIRELFRGQFDHIVQIIFLIILAAVATIFLGTIYSTLSRPRIRRIFAATWIACGILWFLFLVLGTLYPLMMMGEKITP